MNVDFIDSNVFIYLFDTTDLRKQGIARRLIDAALGNDSGRVSFQVVQETLRVITGKLPRRASTEEALAFLRISLMPMWRVMPSESLYTRGLQLQARWQLSFYDALIVAAAQESGCDRLLTEDLQDGQRIDGLLIENPFKP